MTEPTTEQMLEDLRGKIPDTVHAVLVETREWLDEMERRQLREHMPQDNGDGTFTIRKPARYVVRGV